MAYFNVALVSSIIRKYFKAGDVLLGPLTRSLRWIFSEELVVVHSVSRTISSVEQQQLSSPDKLSLIFAESCAGKLEVDGRKVGSGSVKPIKKKPS